MAKVFTIAAYVFFALSMIGLGFLGFNARTIGAESGRFILEMAAISVFGMAILLSVRHRREN